MEPVTREFFADYKRVFDNAKCKITGFANDERRHLFTQTLFNRLMFIHFVQRKGWLSYDGDTDYLKALWQSYRNDGGSPKNFYADRLRLLFFGGLNNYRSEDVTDGPEADRLIGQVPFLNGGLGSVALVCLAQIVPDEYSVDNKQAASPYTSQNPRIPHHRPLSAVVYYVHG